MAGSLLATFAYFVSTYSTNINVLIITYGALGGKLRIHNDSHNIMMLYRILNRCRS